jgi:HK97 family phage prohead protease
MDKSTSPVKQRTVTRAETAVRDNRRLTFYAATFDNETTVTDVAEPYGRRMRYREVVRPGAFRGYLETGGDVRASIDHDRNRTFASRASGELLLQEDSRGLFATCELPRNDLGDRIIRDIEAGRLNGSSFRFATVKDRWTPGNVPLCELEAVALDDVTLTDQPAYASMVGEVHLRHDEHARKLAEWFRRLRLTKLR